MRRVEEDESRRARRTRQPAAPDVGARRDATGGVRAALVSFVYLQYVCKKYQTSYWTMTAVTMLYEKVKGVFHHRWCPKPLGALFDRIAGLVQKYAARSR